MQEHDGRQHFNITERLEDLRREHELPLISEVHFEGLKNVTASEIVTALHNENFDLGPGGIYDPGKMKTVISLIKKELGKNGQKDPKVEVRTEEISFDRVSLTFVISYQ